MKYVTSVVFLILAVSGSAQQLSISTLANPSASGSIQPNWSVTPEGDAVLSWIEPSKNDSYTLRYAVRHGASWSEPRTVAAGRHFFRHPAEAPEVVVLSERHWLAHWVEMPSESSEAEYIYVSSSTDGVKWTTPTVAHRDRSPVEHGLASMVGNGTNEASIFWLQMLKGEDGPADLMRTVVDASGREIKEERLDSDVCTCCPTSVAKTTRGLLVAYRDHTPEDIRDIAVLRLEKGRWSQPKIVHNDNWKINGCPINAASVSAKGDHAVVAWFTGAQDTPRVQAAFSDDGGTTFRPPILVSTGRAFGYTSAKMTDDNTSLISWLERSATGSARVLLRQVSSGGTAGPVLQVAEGGQQGLGYPRLVQSQSAGTLVVWSSPGSRLQTARIDK